MSNVSESARSFYLHRKVKVYEIVFVLEVKEGNNQKMIFEKLKWVKTTGAQVNYWRRVIKMARSFIEKLFLLKNQNNPL